MHLIVTHEQADFDGVAAAFAAHLLDPESTPVLPRRLNRNVRGFLTLYGERLPFIATDDLPKERIERVTLVDTQALPSLRGLASSTEVHVVDHHPQSGELDPSWTHHVRATGAATTILVSELQERAQEPGIVAATLMLLGIYEDTGSLTYAGTTSEDLVASAWLLEQGASLSIAADFLNHPLSADQRQLYEELLETAETIAIRGVPVVIAGAQAGAMVDEVSTLAHKLRDVFDPAGLFVLVGLESNTQLVARSTTRAVDVGKIAEALGGGGHQRAAAALIRDAAVEEVRAALLELLPGAIDPPTKVAELMSRGPQLLQANAKIAEASQRMQRSGHEGYPVVDGKRIVGLLTRGAVDRAMAHGMAEKTVDSVMDAGDLVVHPEDSVDHLQHMMIRYDWGQVPVADPDSGEIVGIVTRTDLLRNLGDNARGEERRNLRGELEAALPPGRLALLARIAETAEEREVALYIVGGFVRDLLLGTPSVDFDLVTEGDAIPLALALAQKFGGTVHSHRRFGTAKWQIEPRNADLREALGRPVTELDLPETVDFVTARSEFYSHPTALPLVQEGSIKLDLHRRDFTINTLALRLDGGYYGKLLDHWGGGEDLNQGLIRVLHSLSFVDDPTRMLRAVRLEQRLGFDIEERTRQLLDEAIPLLDRVSGDRIRGELEQIFDEAAWPQIMERLASLELLAAVHGDLTWDPWLLERWRRIREVDLPERWQPSGGLNRAWLHYALWSFRLKPERAQRVAERLRLSGSDRDSLVEASRLGKRVHEVTGRSAPSEIVRELEEISEKAIVAVWFALEEGEARSKLEQFLSEWRWIRPSVDGNTLRQLGLPPGPVYSSILRRLRDGRLNGEIAAEEDEERMLKKLVDEARSRG